MFYEISTISKPYKQNLQTKICMQNVVKIVQSFGCCYGQHLRTHPNIFSQSRSKWTSLASLTHSFIQPSLYSVYGTALCHGFTKCW